MRHLRYVLNVAELGRSLRVSSSVAQTYPALSFELNCEVQHYGQLQYTEFCYRRCH